MSLFAELKRRNVFKVAAAYLVVGWLVIEVASVLAPQLSLPEWAPRLITFVVLLGFPIALVLAWIFDMTPEGVQVTEGSVGNKRFYGIVAVVAAAALGWFFYSKTPDEVPTEAGDAPSGVAVRAPSSIAVLPFTDLSPEGDQGYFADGVAEEILNLLARNPSLRVVARTSAFQFREAADLRAVGTALGANRILEGSVRTAGTRVRITAQLIDAESGLHLWSETYDRELTDIFRVQDEIAGAIATELGLRLGTTREQAAATQDAEAYHVYLRGLRALNNRNTPGQLEEAINLFTQAIEMDPSFANARGGLALAYAVTPFYELMSQAEALPVTVEASDASLALDRDNVEALLARGYVMGMYGLRFREGAAMLRRALELRPNDVTANNLMGDLAASIGDRAAAFEFESRAASLDPLESIHEMELGGVYFADHNWDQALVHLRRAEALAPLNRRSPGIEVEALVFSGALVAAQQRYDAAVVADRYVWGEVVDGCLLAIASRDADRKAARDRRADAAHQRGDLPAAGRAVVHYLAGEYADAARRLNEEIASGDHLWAVGPFALDMYVTLVREGFDIAAPAQYQELFAAWMVSAWADLPSFPTLLAERYPPGAAQ